jgi:hypothetical protein
MISRVTIANYKSIESADFEARRVNVFIGEPNSGKSNILEAVGLLSPDVLPALPELFRIQWAGELFFDQEIERTIAVALKGVADWKIRFSDDQFNGLTSLGPGSFQMDDHGHVGSWVGRLADPIRYYQYRSIRQAEWQKVYQSNLRPPYGVNLPTLLYTNKVLRESISAFFRAKDFRLELRPQDNEILMSKEVDDVLFSFRFEAISETMRRIVFYKAVLETNKDSVLVLDEPGANTFPFYTKYLAERIALDTSHQFFLSTHNPYVLMSIIEKTPQTELAVYVTRMRNYRTEVQLLTPAQCSEALDLGMDLFLNLERFFPE